MLLISRRKEEAILIGGGIEVRVLAIGRSRVTLAIEAPADVTVLRAEAALAAEQNRAAAAFLPGTPTVAEIARIAGATRRLAGAAPGIPGETA